MQRTAAFFFMALLLAATLFVCHCFTSAGLGVSSQVDSVIDINQSEPSPPPQVNIDGKEASSTLAASPELSEEDEKEIPAEKGETSISKDEIISSHYLTETESQVIDLINEERLSLGLKPLEYHPGLQNAARIRSKELCQAGVTQHTRPDGRSFLTVVQKDIPIPGLRIVGENLASLSSSNHTGKNQKNPPARDWFLLWKGSPKHYDNLIWPGFEKVGVGIYYELRDGDYYCTATVLFGSFSVPGEDGGTTAG